ncbi:MAG: hypothetical protein MI923_11970 [Phycisphaerales bacterium]|nr:hypothetical protein [Phycisphaerales bacterium]
MRFRLRDSAVRFILSIGVLLLFHVAEDASAQHGPPVDDRGISCEPCDANCDSLIDELDIAAFVDALLGDQPGCSPCRGDFDNDGEVNGQDMQPLLDCLLVPPETGACCEPSTACFLANEAECQGGWFGPGSSCDPDPCITGDMTAYRPQHGAGYFPFARTAVSDFDEESSTQGPGIRINAPSDDDPMGEDDLIEVTLAIDQPGAEVALRRSHGHLKVWTTRTKDVGTEIPFLNDKTSSVPFGPGETMTTVWVEWAVPMHGTADLVLEPSTVAASLDVLRFHSFVGIVMALGGEGQVPSVPVDLNHGTFVVAVGLYDQGFDVHLHDEDDVAPDGSGPVFDEVVNAIRHRLVDEVGIFGYSHGGGSTYDLADRLDADRAGIGRFEIRFTSYADAVENDSDVDISQELRRPPSSGYHANHYQNGSFADFFLDGGPVPNSEPSPTGLNVEVTPWGAGATHFEVDDFVQVRDFIETNLVSNVTP